MSDDQSLRDRVLVLESRLIELKDRIEKPPKPPLWRRIVSWDMLKNVMIVVGIPAAGWSAYTVLDEQLISQKTLERQARLSIASAELAELQNFNEGVFVQQAQDNDRVAFAKTEAQRGRVERLTKNLVAFWQDYPEELTRSEKTTLAEALLGLQQTDTALVVANTVDETAMGPIWQGDMDLLRGRILFARGPAQDPDAARDALRAALAHAETHPDDGVRLGLMEKYAAVRLQNEIWLDTRCSDVVPIADFLQTLVDDADPEGGVDEVREVTLRVLTAHARQCPDG